MAPEPNIAPSLLACNLARYLAYACLMTNPLVQHDNTRACISELVSRSAVYPLVAFHARVVLEQQWSNDRRYSLSVSWRALKKSYETEGLRHGVFKGFASYMFHRGLLLLSRFCANFALNRLEDRNRSSTTNQSRTEEEQLESLQKRRWIAKYACEILCYPALTFATRGLLVNPSFAELRRWHEVDGLSLWYHGLWPYVIYIAADDVTAYLVEKRMSHLVPDDRERITQAVRGLVAVLTNPILNISIIRRCHSHLSHLVAPKSFKEQLNCNPWGAIFFEFLLFACLLGANYYVIHLDFEDDDDGR